MGDELFSRPRIDKLLRLARVLEGDAASAEDLVQDCLVRAVTHAHRVKAADRQDAYLRKSLVNAHHDRHRKKRLRVVHLSEAASKAANPGADFEERDALWQAIRGLPTQQRTCVVLRYYEDLEYREIATAMGTRESTVRSNLTRAIETLRAAMTETDPKGAETWTAPNRP